MSDNTELPEDGDDGEFLFQVTWKKTEEGGVGVGIAFGLELEGPGMGTDEMKMYALSKMMSTLALRLASSSIGEEVED